MVQRIGKAKDKKKWTDKKTVDMDARAAYKSYRAAARAANDMRKIDIESESEYEFDKGGNSLRKQRLMRGLYYEALYRW